MEEEEAADGLGAVGGRESESGEGRGGGKVTGYAVGGDKTGHG